MTDERNRALREAAEIADQWATDAQRLHGSGGPKAAILALIDQPEPVPQGVTDGLLPCPFCGGEVRMICDDYINGYTIEHPDYKIECPNKHCCMWWGISAGGDKDELASEWNRRALTTQPVTAQEAARVFIKNVAETEWQVSEPASGWCPEEGQQYVEEMEAFANWIIENAQSIHRALAAEEPGA